MLILGVPRGDLTDEDIGLLETIVYVGTTDTAAACAMIYAYYRDFDRAERTPRGIIYLHLGILAGAAMKEHEAADPLAAPWLRRKAPPH